MDGMDQTAIAAPAASTPVQQHSPDYKLYVLFTLALGALIGLMGVLVMAGHVNKTATTGKTSLTAQKNVGGNSNAAPKQTAQDLENKVDLKGLDSALQDTTKELQNINSSLQDTSIDLGI